MDFQSKTPQSEAPPLLVRIPAESGAWAEDLPPLPTGARVSVAFSDDNVEAEHAEALELLGYHSVGTLPTGRVRAPSVDLLIPRAEADRWPVWRDALLQAGGRVWDLAHGPAASVMATDVAVHTRQERGADPSC